MWCKSSLKVSGVNLSDCSRTNKKKRRLHYKKTVQLFPIFRKCGVLRCFYVWFPKGSAGNRVAGATASYLTSVHCSQTTSCSWRKLFLDNSNSTTHKTKTTRATVWIMGPDWLTVKMRGHTRMGLRWIFLCVCLGCIFKPPTSALLEGGGEKPCWCKWSAGGGESRSQAQFPWCHVWCWETISAYTATHSVHTLTGPDSHWVRKKKLEKDTGLHYHHNVAATFSKTTIRFYNVFKKRKKNKWLRFFWLVVTCSEKGFVTHYFLGGCCSVTLRLNKWPWWRWVKNDPNCQ